jgi:hypothetical protein
LGPLTELLIEAGGDAVPSSEFEMRMTAVVATITAMRRRQIAHTNRVERSGARTCGVVCCVMALSFQAGRVTPEPHAMSGPRAPSTDGATAAM